MNQDPETSQIEPYRFKPGQSGNPGGRPKKLPVTDYLRSQLEAPIPAAMRAKLPPIFIEIYGEEATFGQMLAFKLIQCSAKGDIFAMKELLDRVEGKVVQKSEIFGKDGAPIEVEVTDARNKLAARLSRGSSQSS